MNKDLIPVIAIGGALGIIVFLSSKNQNKADEVYMPYGWGSFNNSNNPLQPINTTPTPAPTPKPKKPVILPVIKPAQPISGKYPPPVLSPGYTIIDYPFHKNPYIEPQPPPAPMGFTTTPMVSKPVASFTTLSPTAVRDTVKPVTGRKVI